jgi:hypothetical protein
VSAWHTFLLPFFLVFLIFPSSLYFLLPLLIRTCLLLLSTSLLPTYFFFSRSPAKSTKKFNLSSNPSGRNNFYRLEAQVLDTQTGEELFECSSCQKTPEVSSSSRLPQPRSFIQIRCPYLPVVKKGFFRLPITFACVPSHQTSTGKAPR